MEILLRRWSVDRTLVSIEKIGVENLVGGKWGRIKGSELFVRLGFGLL